MRAGEIGKIVGVAIEMGIDVVAAGFVVAIIDPTVGGSIRVEGWRDHERRQNVRRLSAERGGRTGRKRRRAVAGVDAITGVAQVARQAMAKKEITGISIDNNSIRE